jgi:putative nucleotidyltransferase with HDIG domain
MRIGRKIFVTEIGSSIYGTRVPTSDRDFKGIFLPHYEDILLQRAGQTAIQDNSKKDPRARNTCADRDMEWISLHAFLRLCAEGQSMVLDMLFTPPHFWVAHDPLWSALLQERQKLLCKKITAIVGYCRQQAARYGIKGARLAAVRQVVQVLQRYPGQVKLNEVDFADFSADLGTSPHISFVFCRGPRDSEELHLQVCNRKVSMNARCSYALGIFKKIYDQYGERSRLAEAHEGVDWKALMHAIRVSAEAKELLTTGSISFPRPEREFLLSIRRGEIEYAAVVSLLETSLAEIEELRLTSSLPEEVDKAYWDQWLVRVYADWVDEQAAISRSYVTMETVRAALIKIMNQGRLSAAIRWMDQHGVLSSIFPEVVTMQGVEQDIYYHSEGDVFTHTLLVLEKANAGVVPQLAALLHDIGKPATQTLHPQEGRPPRIKFLGHETIGARMSDDILRRLKFDECVIERVNRIIRLHLRGHSFNEWKAKAYRKFLRDCGDDVENVLHLTEIDGQSSFGPDGKPKENCIPELRLRLKKLADK